MDQDTITSQSYLDSEAKQYRSEKSVIASSQPSLRWSWLRVWRQIEESQEEMSPSSSWRSNYGFNLSTTEILRKNSVLKMNRVTY